MKNMVKSAGATLVFIGAFFILAATADASGTSMLQPAAAIIYNEDLTVNGTGRFDSVYIGKQDVGGVTFFNGTIVNATTNNGADNPVTFGDNVRIDGEIFRLQKGGDPIKISDSIIPTLADLNDLGSTTNKWQDVYYSGKLQGGSAEFSENIQVSGVSGLTDNDIPNDITVSDYLPLTGGTLNGSLSASGYHYNSAQTRYWSVGGPEFIAGDDAFTYSTTAYSISETTGYFNAPVHLPHGALIKKMKVSYYDNSSNNFSVRFRCESMNENNGSYLGLFYTSGAQDNVKSGEVPAADIPCVNVDNNNYKYHVYLQNMDGTIFHKLLGVVIEYAISDPLP